MVLVPELITLAGLFTALGLIAIATALVYALFKTAEATVGWIPWLGQKAKGGLEATRKRLVNHMSGWIVGVEGAIAFSWHLSANLVEQTGAAIWDATRLGAKALWYVEVKYPLDVLSALAHKARGTVTVTQKIAGATVQKVTVVKGITQAQLARFGKRLAVLEARVAAFPVLGAGAIALPLPRIGALERGAKVQGKRIGRLERRLGGVTFAALVAGALAKLGLNWIRKPCAKRTSDSFCRVNTDLLDVLTYGIAVSATTLSFRQFVEASLFVEEEVMNAIAWTVPELGDAIALASSQDG